MQYEKPQLVFVASALDVIQCQGLKRNGFPDNECPGGSGTEQTAAAYEVDE